MPLPSDIQAIIRVTEDAGSAALADGAGVFARAGRDAIVKGQQALNGWRNRMATLNDRWGRREMTTLDFGRAVESEREALTFNLASIPNEEARAVMSGLLGASLSFLGRILGAVGG